MLSIPYSWTSLKITHLSGRVRFVDEQTLFVTEQIRELMKTREFYQKFARESKDTLAWNAFKNFNWEVKREIYEW